MSLMSSAKVNAKESAPVRLPEPKSHWDLPTPALLIDLDGMEANLYDHYYPFRGETVEEIWPIAARGRSQ